MKNYTFSQFDSELENHSVHVNPAFDRLMTVDSILMLQGPNGPLFSKLEKYLSNRGQNVHRVVFNGGDLWDSRNHPLDKLHKFNLHIDYWVDEFKYLINKYEIKAVLLFGQHRPVHLKIIDFLKSSNIDLIVLEEGYFRPGFATIELGGVNSYSSTLSKYSINIFNQASPNDNNVKQCRNYFFKTSVHACIYYLNLNLFKYRFPFYMHHRDTSLTYYAWYYINSFLKKKLQAGQDKIIVRNLQSKTKFYFIPLQVFNDSQLKFHSSFGSVIEFIEIVLRSFSNNASKEKCLLIKQHPLSSGNNEIESYIYRLALELGIASRVYLIWSGDIQSILRSSIGVILINSTVAFEALQHNKPLFILGESILKKHIQSNSITLDEFFIDSPVVDPEAGEELLTKIKLLTQIPCHIYANKDEPWIFLKTF